MTEFIDTEIGPLPSDWDIIKIDQIKSTKKHSIAMGPFGSNITKDNFIDHGVPVIRGNNLTGFTFNDDDFVFVSEKKAEELKASQCRRRDIIITHRGTLGQVGYIPENSKYKKYIVSQSGMKLTVDEEIIDSKFVFYFLKSPRGQYLLLRNSSQTGVPAIAQPTTSLKSISIPVPPKNEVLTIKNIIDSIQDKIELLRRENETLEGVAQVLFKRWFVEFEFPNEEGKPYKSSGGKMTPSPLGEIPTHWQAQSFLEEFDLLSGGTPKTSVEEYWGGDIGWISAKDITQNHRKFIFDTEKTITEEGLSNSATRLLPKYTTVLTARGTVGNFCILAESMCISQSNYGIKSKKTGRDFTTYLSISHLIDKLKSQAYGSVFDTITSYTFKGLDVISPHDDIVERFEKSIDPIFLKILTNTKIIISLTRIRDLILPELMGGRIRVGDAGS
jgi:type I restriction enzyme S subunit